MRDTQLITHMTLEEKCALLSGGGQFTTMAIPRLGIPALYLSDGPLGVRRQADAADHLGLNPSLPATCWPAPAAMANAWDPELEEELGRCLGEEAAAQGVNVLLAPGLNTKRSPLCGRNFEYFSEDPYLSGKLAAACIRGIQSQGVAACPKHFAANSQETLRMHSDSVVDERTLRELYLTGFEIAVREGRPRWIMSSYNRINGVYANENRRLLRDILVDEWGFDGCVVSDWGGSNDHAAGVTAGSHLEMPGAGPAARRELVRAVADGRLPEAWLDQMVGEMLDSIRAFPPRDADPGFDQQAHHATARRIAAQTVVLLKNEGGLLPLRPGTRVAVVGPFADRPRIQGGGSSGVNPTRVDRPLDVLAQSGLEVVGYAPGLGPHGEADCTLLAEAVSLAGQAETVLLYLGTDALADTEGLDRSVLSLDEGQNALVEAVLRANPNTVVVLTGGSAMELPWLDRCPALVYACLGGQAGAGAVADVLTGVVNPSGKLAESWPIRLEDVPCARYFPGRERTAEYREGIFVGYRYYQTVGCPVRFPFGFGLSYTTFAYSNLTADAGQVSFTLTNTGPAAGAETAQLYISKQDSALFRPALELKGFSKVYLEPGESRRVTIPLDEYALRCFHPGTGRWEIEGGTYLIQVGASCADLRLTIPLTVEGSDAPVCYGLASLPHYASGRVSDVPDEEFALLLGRPIPPALWDRSVPLDENDTFTQLCYARGWVGRLVHWILRRRVDRAAAAHRLDLNVLFCLGMPFRALAKFLGGVVDTDMVRALLDVFNGRTCRGALCLLSAWRRRRSADRKGGGAA